MKRNPNPTLRVFIFFGVSTFVSIVVCNFLVPFRQSGIIVDSQSALNYSHSYQNLYSPLGYHVCDRGSQCWLFLKREINCSSLFLELLQSFQMKPLWPPPHIHNLSSDLRHEFLLGSASKLSTWYIAEPGGDGSGVLVWKENDAVFAYTQQRCRQNLSFPPYVDSVRLSVALRKHASIVNGLKGAVFGSQTSWVEAVAFFYGAAHVTTIEYYKITSYIPNHEAMKPKEWALNMLSGNYSEVDFAISFSSLEHDGLGRYGDPLSPFADVNSMQRISCYVKQKGYLFLAVPTVSYDEIQFNAHRLYGPLRYPLLTANWRPIDIIYDKKVDSGAFCDNLWDDYRQIRGGDHPVIVLQNVRSSPCS